MKTLTKITRQLLIGAIVLVSPFVPAALVTAETCVQPPSGLISWLPGDGNAKDIVGTNDGTLQDGATFGTGLVGQAFSFDGTSSVTLSSPPAVSAVGSWTYDLWINVVAFTNNTSIQDSGGSYFIDRTAETPNLADLNAVNNQFGFQIRFNDHSGLGGPVGGAITPQVWTHIAMVREYGVAFRLYVDGSLVASTADNGNSLTPPIPKLGHHDVPTTHHGFVGLIDEFEIFGRALSQSEIQAIFNAGSAGKCKIKSVSIDIKPGSFPNSINLNSAGVVPVAILSSSTFDATTVDPDTITLAGAKVKMVGKSGKLLCHNEDVSSDGRLDMVCQVETAQFMIEPGDSIAILEAKTVSGTEIRGEDSINIVP